MLPYHLQLYVHALNKQSLQFYQFNSELVFFVDNSLRQLSLLSNVEISSDKSYGFSTDFSLSLLEPKAPTNLRSKV